VGIRRVLPTKCSNRNPRWAILTGSPTLSSLAIGHRLRRQGLDNAGDPVGLLRCVRRRCLAGQILCQDFCHRHFSTDSHRHRQSWEIGLFCFKTQFDPPPAVPPNVQSPASDVATNTLRSPRPHHEQSVAGAGARPRRFARCSCPRFMYFRKSSRRWVDVCWRRRKSA
jgi:hypothetical protein